MHTDSFAAWLFPFWATGLSIAICFYKQLGKTLCVCVCVFDKDQFRFPHTYCVRTFSPNGGRRPLKGTKLFFNEPAC